MNYPIHIIMCRHFHGAVSNRRYFNFTGQAQLFERLYTEEKREGVEYEPCERCRLRGGRCARCKALRTGGGYIILDEGENSNLVTSKRRKGFGRYLIVIPPFPPF